jgi:hypothetical protein
MQIILREFQYDSIVFAHLSSKYISLEGIPYKYKSYEDSMQVDL